MEQSTSVTYPNVLILDYLKRTGKASPEARIKAEQFINLGYQRLLTFEVEGGGFDWFGRGPAKTVLSAYGLMHLVDMARVAAVDPALIDRTRALLLQRQQPNGSWPAEGALHSKQRRPPPLHTKAGPSRRRSMLAEVLGPLAR